MNGHFCSTKSLIYSDVLRVFPSPPLLLSAQSCVPPFTPRTEKNRRPRRLGVVTHALEEEGKQRKDEGTEMLLESGGDDNREVATHVQLLASDAFIVKLSARGDASDGSLTFPVAWQIYHSSRIDRDHSQHLHPCPSSSRVTPRWTSEQRGSSQILPPGWVGL